LDAYYYNKNINEIKIDSVRRPHGGRGINFGWEISREAVTGKNKGEMVRTILG
jgi:hypothetical protein